MYHMARVCERYQIGTKGFSPEVFDALMAYEWPGNVRELVNAIERAISDASMSLRSSPNICPSICG